MEINFTEIDKHNSIEEPLFYYCENVLDYDLLEELQIWLDNKEFKNGYNIGGKQIPRQQLWYQKDNKYFCEEWKSRYDRWVSEEYMEFLQLVQNKIQSKLYSILDEFPKVSKPCINSCLINKYRDGQDSIKPHSDCQQSFGEYPTIANFSIGGTREIVLQNRFNKETIKFNLGDNSLFIMAGGSQKYFSHEIPKCDSDEVRYSMTFREYLLDDE
jgi:alkylated DNA repair dioxygenase AlkB